MLDLLARRLHVRQRAARPPLRHSERLRQPFRRVALGDGQRARGLLGHGSMLTVTSYANRTSPVLRGKWVLENILGTAPAATAAERAAARHDRPVGKVLSMRERMAQHRANPACAGLSQLMDPAGLSMENFDAIGRWRTRTEAGTPVDASGGLPGGTTFEGVAGLRKAVLSRPELFVTTVTEKLLTYALGRGLELHDAPAVRAIARDARATGLPVFIDRAGCGEERAVPDASAARCPNDERAATIRSLHDHHEDALPRRTFLRGMGDDAGAAAARCDGACCARRSRRPLRSPCAGSGFVYIPMGANWTQWTPSAEGRITTLSPSLQSLMPFLDQVTVISNLELRERLHDGQPRVRQLRVPELRPGEAHRRHRLRARHHGRSDRGQGDRPRHADSVARARHRFHRAGRQLRQRLRVCVPEQPVLVVADDAAADRSRPRVVFERLFGDGGTAGAPARRPPNATAASSTG